MSMVMNEMVDHYKGVRQRMADAANRHRLDKIAEAKAKVEADALAAAALAEKNKHITRQQIERVKRQWEEQIAITKQQLALRKRDWLKITDEIIDAREISWRELVSPDRSYRLVAARQHVWYAIRLELKLSYPQIAAKFGRDHTTIMHGCQQHAKRIGVTLDQPKKSPSYAGGDTGHHHAERNGVRRPKAVVQARLTVRDDLARQDIDAIRRSHRNDVREVVAHLERAEA
jgi:hypothetical protein